MKEWLISISAVCLLIILLELLLCEGNTKKYIQGILRLAIIVILIAPIIALVNNDSIIQKSEILYETESKSESDYSDMNDKIINIYEKKIENELHDLGGTCDVSISLTKKNKLSVKIIVKENGINEKGENIYTNENIKAILTKYLTVDKEDILIYGI